MKQTLLILFFGSLTLFSCRKDAEVDLLVKDYCLPQQENPTGRSYTDEHMSSVNYMRKNCGFMPLSSASYWVYQDSVYTNGTFDRIEYDTLKFKSYQSYPDGLIWWEPNMRIGLPNLLYANDSAIFSANYRLFAPDPIRDTRIEYRQFVGDSIKYLTSFDDNAALGRSVKLDNSLSTPCGKYQDCILFEKKAPFYRTDQIYFKPGLGVVKYITSEAPMGSPFVMLQHVSTLVGFHID